GFGFDPRFAITWTPRPGHRFRFATGIYHQAPEAQLLDQDFGNPDLELMRSRHLVLGYQYREATDPLHIRVEVYDKDYEHLPLESTELGFSDDGRGWARGLDLLVKGSRGRWSGWMSFGTIDSRRLSTRWIDFGRFPVPDEPVRNPLAVPHTLQLSSEWVLPHGISLAGTYRWAAGQPFTPITGATEVEGRFAPVYGEIGSDEYPDFRRLDLNATKALPFLDSGLAIAFVGISNVFDRQSTFSYVYSADYSSRRPSRTSFGRSLYLGITLIR
ncbi:MAG: TonB-dependent receptor, partial [Acidobacteriota bacterium]